MPLVYFCVGSRLNSANRSEGLLMWHGDVECLLDRWGAEVASWKTVESMDG